MLRKLVIRLVMALLPLVLGLGGMVILHLVMPEIPLLVFKVDFGTVMVVLGGIVSLILLAWGVGWSVEVYRGVNLLEDERIQQIASRRRFIRRLDHELKNPLTGLRAAVVNLKSLLTSEYPRPPADAGGESSTGMSEASALGFPWAEASRTINDAQYQIERLSRLVADLRKLAELEERPLEFSQVNIADLLAETVEAVRALPAYSLREIHLSIPRVPWPPPDIQGDRDLLELAFYNLVENALKYSCHEDIIEVRAVEDGRRLQIEVADNGAGIPADDLPRIFDELYRGANAVGLDGSGLGLALVKRVIERHAGEINVRSRQGEQQGTIFRVVLPIR
jgi:two-component system, OmpR family, sensor kinase